MDNIQVTINSRGEFSPKTICPNPGDKVTFVAEGAEIVVCIEPELVFEATRLEIDNGAQETVTVSPKAKHVLFRYRSKVDDSEPDCDQRWVFSYVLGKGEGGGTTGP